MLDRHPYPWSIAPDDYAYEVRVLDANGKTVCIVPMSVRVIHHDAPQGVKRVVDRDGAMEVARHLARTPCPCRCELKPV